MEIKSEVDTWTCEHTTKDCVVYISQLSVCLIVIITAIVNLSLSNNDKNQSVWLVLLSSCLGYILPSPSMKKN
jgi:hypothetical protein